MSVVRVTTWGSSRVFRPGECRLQPWPLHDGPQPLGPTLQDSPPPSPLGPNSAFRLRHGPLHPTPTPPSCSPYPRLRWDPFSDSRKPRSFTRIQLCFAGFRSGLVMVCVVFYLSMSFLQAQVSRMLRLSENDEKVAREFRAVYARGEEEDEASVIGRVFRSPTLFEDMVKCILLCNCQWPRTLSMAEALCDLQLELQLKSLLHGKSEDFMPKTPAGREVEPKKKLQNSKASKCLAAQFTIETKVLEPHSNEMSSVATAQNLSRDAGFDRVGSFPTPVELAKLDENFLAKGCKLGYRARRIVKLAQGIVEGRIQLRQLEETCMERSLCSYKKLAEQLREIDGFGPFTCANVLMCMGFYHVIPTDSETIRHLKQVHAKESTIRTMEADVQNIYPKYAPFQFLAYWSELWNFYEKKFGKLSEMPSSAYKLITASNMRTKPRQQNKRKKTA